jgi:hypothetical protein
MAAANDYLHAIERCICSAELTPSEEVKQIWLTVVDSYRLLIAADKARWRDPDRANQTGATQGAVVSTIVKWILDRRRCALLGFFICIGGADGLTVSVR